MNLRQLEYVAAVMQYGSLKKAAEHLFVTEATLSQQIRVLEEEIAVKLMRREPYGMRPTHAGAALLEDVRRILTAVEAFRNHARDLAGLQTGTVRVGTTHTGAMTLLRRVVKDFVAQYPGVELTVVEEDTATLAHRLARDELDLALLATSPEGPTGTSDLRLVQLLDGHISVVCSAGDRLAGAPAVERCALRGRRLILQRPGYLVREVVLRAILGPDLGAQPVYSCGNTVSMREMIRNGVGLGFLPNYAGYDDMYAQAGAIRFVDLVDPIVPFGLALATRDAAHYLSRAARAFITLVQQEARRFCEQYGLRSPDSVGADEDSES